MMQNLDKRIGMFEAIRGLAAIQVLLLHYISAYCPRVVVANSTSPLGEYIRNSPAFFLYNGFVAVYIFFILSGLVLTFAYLDSKHEPLSLLAARIVRLGVPVTLSCVLAIFCITVFAPHNILAGKILGSEWFGTYTAYYQNISLTGLLKDIINIVFIGYEGTSMWTHLGFSVHNAKVSSLNPVLWTIHIELYGSILILVLCSLKKANDKLWVISAFAAGLLFFKTYFLCFIVGHILARLYQTNRNVELPNLICLALIITGILLGQAGWRNSIETFRQFQEYQYLLFLFSTQSIQVIYAAILIFLGVFYSRKIRRVLEHRYLLALGKYSFSIYLVHWPVLYTISALSFLKLYPVLGDVLARVTCFTLGITMSVFVAISFRNVDVIAIKLSHITKNITDNILGIKKQSLKSESY